MEQPDIDDLTCITIDVLIEIYLKHRADPMSVMATFRIHTGIFDDVDELEMFTGITLTTIMEILDTKGEQRYVFSDSRYNKTIVLVDEIQAISVLAPSAETIKQAILEAE